MRWWLALAMFAVVPASAIAQAPPSAPAATPPQVWQLDWQDNYCAVSTGDLATAGLVAREAARVLDRLAQGVRHLDPRELLGGKRHELRAHVLQLVHLLLAPGLADKIVFVHSWSVASMRKSPGTLRWRGVHSKRRACAIRGRSLRIIFLPITILGPTSPMPAWLNLHG